MGASSTRIILPSYVSPKGMSFQDYGPALRQSNRAFQRKVGVFLAEKLEDAKGDYAILTTGSDGRFEKGPYNTSKLEFIVVAPEDVTKLGLVRVLNGVIELEPLFIDHDIEVKRLGVDALSPYRGDRQRLFPTRIMDSVLLYGSSDVHNSSKRMLIDEFVGPDGKRVFESVKDRRADFKKVLACDGVQMFKGEQVKHYEFSDGDVVAFFNPDKYVLGFKTGPLRFVQYGLMSEVIRSCRAGANRSALLDLPTNLGERLYALQADNLLACSADETRDVVNSYNFFVWAYNLSQEAFQLENKSEVVFDGKEVRERISDLLKVFSKPVLR